MRAFPFAAGAVWLALSACAPPVHAQLPPVLQPGDTLRFVGADIASSTSPDCNAVNGCGVNFEDLGEERPRALAYSTVTVGIGIERRATARLVSLFAIGGDNENRIGAKLSGRLAWRGWLMADFGAWTNESNAEISVGIYDVTTATSPADLTRNLVARETVYDNAVAGQFGTVPSFERAIGGGSFNLAVDLFRGHRYAAIVEVSCRSASGPVGIGTAASFYDVSLAGFNTLDDGFVERSLMILRTEPDYLELIEGLREQLRSHRHEYLTGRGEGHNNTTATTSEALGIDDGGGGMIGGLGPSLEVETIAPDRVQLIAHLPPAAQGVATIERRAGDAWLPIGIAAAGEAFVDRDVTAGSRYAYRARCWASGIERTGAVLEIELPALVGFSLGGAWPNPSSSLRMRFMLPDAAPATLEVFDVAGRRVLSREVGTLGPGDHRLTLARPGELAAGVYVARLQRGESALTGRVVVVP